MITYKKIKKWGILMTENERKIIEYKIDVNDESMEDTQSSKILKTEKIEDIQKLLPPYSTKEYVKLMSELLYLKSKGLLKEQDTSAKYPDLKVEDSYQQMLEIWNNGHFESKESAHKNVGINIREPKKVELLSMEDRIRINNEIYFEQRKKEIEEEMQKEEIKRGR
jgi:hypothetical protein